jgi:hypothetical protein
MPFSMERTTRRRSATSNAIQNAAQMRDRDSLRQSNVSSASALCWGGDSDTILYSDSDSDSSAEADTGIKMSTSDDASPSVHQESDADLDSKAEEILKDIA